MSASDQALSQSITKSLSTAGMSSDTINRVHIRAINGRVLLTGQVNSQSEKERIENQVKQTPGVRNVINQLRVGGSDSSSALPSSLDSSPSSSSGTDTTSPAPGTSPR